MAEESSEQSFNAVVIQGMPTVGLPVLKRPALVDPKTGLPAYYQQFVQAPASALTAGTPINSYQQQFATAAALPPAFQPQQFLSLSRKFTVYSDRPFSQCHKLV